MFFEFFSCLTSAAPHGAAPLPFEWYGMSSMGSQRMSGGVFVVEGGFMGVAVPRAVLALSAISATVESVR